MTTQQTWRDADSVTVAMVLAALLGLAEVHHEEAVRAEEEGDDKCAVRDAQRSSAIIDAITVLAAARATGDRNP